MIYPRTDDAVILMFQVLLSKLCLISKPMFLWCDCRTCPTFRAFGISMLHFRRGKMRYINRLMIIHMMDFVFPDARSDRYNKGKIIGPVLYLVHTFCI